MVFRTSPLQYPVSIIRPLHHFVMLVEYASRRRLLCPSVTIDKCQPAGLFVLQFASLCGTWPAGSCVFPQVFWYALPFGGTLTLAL